MFFKLQKNSIKKYDCGRGYSERQDPNRKQNVSFWLFRIKI